MPDELEDYEDEMLERNLSLPPDERVVARSVFMDVQIDYTGTKADEEEQIMELAQRVRAVFVNRATIRTQDGEVIDV